MWYYTCTYFLNFLFYLSLEGTDNIRSSEQILNDNEIPNLRLPCSWIYMYSNYIFISTYDVLYTRVQCTWSTSQWPAYITSISKHWVTVNTGKIMHNHLIYKCRCMYIHSKECQIEALYPHPWIFTMVLKDELPSSSWHSILDTPLKF